MLQVHLTYWIIWNLAVLSEQASTYLAINICKLPMAACYCYMNDMARLVRLSWVHSCMCKYTSTITASNEKYLYTCMST